MIGKILDCLATVLLVAYIDLKTGFWTLYARAHALSYISVSSVQPQYATLIIKQTLVLIHCHIYLSAASRLQDAILIIKQILKG